MIPWKPTEIPNNKLRYSVQCHTMKKSNVSLSGLNFDNIRFIELQENG